jgi:hypothetical protein
MSSPSSLLADEDEDPELVAIELRVRDDHQWADYATRRYFEAPQFLSDPKQCIKCAACGALKFGKWLSVVYGDATQRCELWYCKLRCASQHGYRRAMKCFDGRARG